MTCRDLVTFLLDYLSGDLPAAERATFEAHLRDCPHCVTYVHGYRQAMRLAKAALADPDAPPPADVPDDLLRAIMTARKSPP